MDFGVAIGKLRIGDRLGDSHIRRSGHVAFEDADQIRAEQPAHIVRPVFGNSLAPLG
jgi:hypothetical protein